MRGRIVSVRICAGCKGGLGAIAAGTLFLLFLAASVSLDHGRQAAAGFDGYLFAAAFAGDDASDKDAERAQRQAERAQQQAEQQATKAQRDADRQARELVRQQAQEARLQGADARRQALDARKQTADSSGLNDDASSDDPANTRVTSEGKGDGNNGNSWGPGGGAGSKSSGNQVADSKDSKDDRGTGKPEANSKTGNTNNKNKPGKDAKNDKGDDRDPVVAEPEDTEPPRTFVEMLNKWSGGGKNNGAGQNGNGGSRGGSDDAPGRGAGQGKPQATGDDGTGTPVADSSDDEQAAVPPGTVKVAKGNSSSAQANAQKAVPGAKTKQPTPGQVKRGPDFELLALGSFKPHEIIASSLSPAAAKRANELGFKTATKTAAPGQSGTVMRLLIPSNMTENAALALLETELPASNFGPNHVYHIVPASDDTPTQSDQASGKGSSEGDGASAAANVPCAGDHCFARDLIAWKPQLKACARHVKVGLIDTSFDTAHPVFANHRFTVGRFAGDNAAGKSDWHGTAVLSVLAGSSTSGTPGLVPDAEFLLASTFSTDGAGNASADTISVLKALSWLDSQGADIINMSFSGPRNDLIEGAIAAMAAKGVTFVAAAGNGGVTAPASYPAAYKDVIAVTAINKSKQNYRHANRGDYVDISAPGVDVWIALPGGAQGYRTGTSFAAPFITGLLAAMPAARKGALSKEDVLARVSFQDLGEPGRDPVYGEGLPIAPQSCDEVGGVASLPWTNEAKRMSVGAPKPEPAAWTPVTSAVARPASR